MFNDRRLFVTEMLVILISGICWYFGNGLTGDYWWMVWIAPYPLLRYSLYHSSGKSFLVSFAACLLGRLSWLSYLSSVAGLITGIIFCVVLAVTYAAIITWSVRLIKMKPKAWTAFTYPVLFSAFEFTVANLSPDGTAGSLSYSQSNKLLIIQLASLTGITGITFLISLLPSAVAVTMWQKHNHRKYLSSLLPALLLIAAAFIFSWQRLSNKPAGAELSVGLVSLNERMHDMSALPDSAKAVTTAKQYADNVSKIADHGAKLVVLPERALFINQANMDFVIRLYQQLAKDKNIFIVAGYTNHKTGIERNSSFVIDPNGELVADYDKIHLVTGLEKRFTPGADPGFYQIGRIAVGAPICKDLDFPRYILKYGRKPAGLLTVPAWDFEKDDWLHARMAVLRSVEGGFSMVRSAREGRLSISDQFGTIIKETSTAKGNAASLIGDISIQPVTTSYKRYGDWFGWLNAAMALLFLGMLGIGSRNRKAFIVPNR